MYSIQLYKLLLDYDDVEHFLWIGTKSKSNSPVNVPFTLLSNNGSLNYSNDVSEGGGGGVKVEVMHSDYNVPGCQQLVGHGNSG